jgi:hypothetical protein
METSKRTSKTRKLIAGFHVDTAENELDGGKGVHQFLRWVTNFKFDTPHTPQASSH